MNEPVTLTDTELDQLREAYWPVDPPQNDHTFARFDRIAKAVEAIVAARTPEYTETTKWETRAKWLGCSCGHPGAGCYCRPVPLRTGRFRTIRKYAKTVSDWQYEEDHHD